MNTFKLLKIKKISLAASMVLSMMIVEAKAETNSQTDSLKDAQNVKMTFKPNATTLQKTDMRGDGKSGRITGLGTDPLYVLDGVRIDDISKISPQDIEEITVLKNEDAIKTYGEKAVNGVVLIRTKKNKAEQPLVKVSNEDWKMAKKDVNIATGNHLGLDDAIILLDGVEISKEATKNIDPNDIEMVEVDKSSEGKLKYGEKAKNGIIKITTKKKK
jgi:outer membrane receptor protein involved in Fe transport